MDKQLPAVSDVYGFNRVLKVMEKVPVGSYPGPEVQCLYIKVLECSCKSVS